MTHPVIGRYILQTLSLDLKCDINGAKFWLCTIKMKGSEILCISNFSDFSVSCYTLQEISPRNSGRWMDGVICLT